MEWGGGLGGFSTCVGHGRGGGGEGGEGGGGRVVGELGCGCLACWGVWWLMLIEGQSARYPLSTLTERIYQRPHQILSHLGATWERHLRAPPGSHPSMRVWGTSSHHAIFPSVVVVLSSPFQNGSYFPPACYSESCYGEYVMKEFDDGMVRACTRKRMYSLFLVTTVVCGVWGGGVGGVLGVCSRF